MVRLLGHGEGNTVLILTDAESRLLRRYFAETGGDHAAEARDAFNRGIMRGTERIRTEAAELARAKKAECK